MNDNSKEFILKCSIKFSDVKSATACRFVGLTLHDKVHEYRRLIAGSAGASERFHPESEIMYCRLWDIKIVFYPI